jgi:hypothetical protein
MSMSNYIKETQHTSILLVLFCLQFINVNLFVLFQPSTIYI